MAMPSRNKAEQELYPVIDMVRVHFHDTNVAGMADMKKTRQSKSLQFNFFLVLFRAVQHHASF